MIICSFECFGTEIQAHKHIRSVGTFPPFATLTIIIAEWWHKKHQKKIPLSFPHHTTLKRICKHYGYFIKTDGCMFLLSVLEHKFKHGRSEWEFRIWSICWSWSRWKLQETSYPWWKILTWNKNKNENRRKKRKERRPKIQTLKKYKLFSNSQML